MGEHTRSGPQKAYAGAIVAGVAAGLAFLAGAALDDAISLGEAIGSLSAAVGAAASAAGIVYGVTNRP